MKVQNVQIQLSGSNALDAVTMTFNETTGTYKYEHTVVKNEDGTCTVTVSTDLAIIQLPCITFEIDTTTPANADSVFTTVNLSEEAQM